MTINYCDKEDRYWIKDGDQTLTFASSLDAKQALREIELRHAVDDEVALIVEWLRDQGECEYDDLRAYAIEQREYRNGR